MTFLKAAGLVTVIALLAGGCGVSKNDENPGTPPAAAFSFSPSYPAIGQDITFSDLSTGSPTAWSWDFGDGGSSSLQNPSHAYASSGTKTVRLTVRNSAGSDTAGQTITVAALAASFMVRPFLPAPGRAVQFTDTSLGGATSWTWAFGDGGTSAAESPSHAYAAAGTYEVSLSVANASGTSSTVRTVFVTTEAVLPPDRLIDWTQAGIPGGIPGRTTVFRTLTPSNSLADINAAIADCPSGQVVFLTAGIYNLGGISFGSKSGVTLRGAGPGLTVINSTAVDAVASSELSFMEADGTALNSGFTKGSTRIVLASSPSSLFRAGNLVQITQADDPGALGNPGVGVYHRTGFPGVWGMSTTRNLRFTSRIAAVAGSTITLATPIPYSFSAALSPRAYPLRDGPGPSLCGLESLTIRGGAGTDKALNFSGADRCWIKDVEVSGAIGQIGIVYFRHSSQCEIRRCYVHDARGFPNQDDGYAYFLYYGCSYGLVVDSIAYRVGNGVIINGSSANAVLYNLVEYAQRAGHAWVDQGIIVNHGPHGIMNLIEGNVTQRFQNDGYHGSTSHSVLFRNAVTGVRTGAVEPRRPIDLCRGSYDHSVVGNVIGDESWSPAYYDMPANPSSVSAVYILGFPGMDSVSMAAYSGVPWDGWTKSTSVPDPDVAGTLLRHGNYDFYHHDTVWDIDIASHDIPASLFYSSKPAFFGSLQWPPIGPDVPGLVTDIPARARWKAYQSSGNLGDLFGD